MKKIVQVALAVLSVHTAVFATPVQTSNNISLQITDYTHNQGHVLVHTTVPITAGMIMAKGVQPLKISITNNQHRPVILTKDSLKVSLSDPYYLSRKFHSLNQFTSSNFFDWMWISLLINGVAFTTLGWTVVVPTMQFFTAGWLPGGFLAFIYWWKTGNKNNAMTSAFLRDVSFLSGKDRVVIYPGQTLERVLLFPKGAVDACTLRVFNEAGTESVAGFSLYMSV